MNNSTTINRRAFIQSSGLALGGLTIAVSIPSGVLRAGDGQDFAPSPFLHIAPNGDTTLWCGRCEMGQGISTALPAAVADELEADWSRVTVLQGDGDKKYGPQATGGSNSINQMFEPMRKAGAAGREMLVAAAAQTWGLDPADCRAHSHFVHNSRDDRRLGYGELASLASTLDVPAEPRLKERSEFRYIGKPVPRHDQKAIVEGKRIYGSDARVPGVHYAAIRHVPVMGGSVRALDDSQARAMDGVVDVVKIDRFAHPYGTLGGVAVVARDSWTAQQALTRLQVEWEAGEHGGYNTDEYKKELVRQVEAPGESVFKRGDVDRALADAAVTHAATYVGGHLSHSPMEPMASLAWVQDDSCEIWASTQDPQGIQRTIAALLGRQPEDITVHVMAAGGAFGRKFKCDYVTEAVILSQKTGVPVQLTWSREEDTRTGYYHSCSANHLQAAVDSEGNVSAWLHRAAFPSIPTTFDPSVVRPSADDLDAISKHPFGIPNMRVETGLAPAHTRIGWYRAVYAIFYGFAINSFFDELALKAGEDPYQFLRRIYLSDRDPELADKARRSLGVLDKAAEMASWGRKLPAGQGLGIAVHHSFESYVAMVVHAEVDGDTVHVHRVDCAVDCGLVLNPDIATAQMEGAVIMGIGLALYTEVQFKDGAVVNSNFHDYPVLRMSEAPPEIHVEFIGQEATPTGLGEPGVPTLAPALANAIFAASGQRHRSLPIRPV